MSWVEVRPETIEMSSEVKTLSDFEKRKKEFESKIISLQEEFWVILYWANIVQPNWEVYPALRIIDAKWLEESKK